MSKDNQRGRNVSQNLQFVNCKHVTIKKHNLGSKFQPFNINDTFRIIY